jgi:hypothetical protein
VPLCIFIYPDHVETVFDGRKRVVSRETRTIKGPLRRAKKAAETLRAEGWKVTVYRSEGRIRIEVKPPVGDHAFGPKCTKTFATETDAVDYLKSLMELRQRSGLVSVVRGTTG